MSQAETLFVVPSLRAAGTRGDAWTLTRKFVDGVRAYAARWPGPVVVLMRRDGDAGGNLDDVTVDPAGLPFGLEALPAGDDALAARLRGGRLVLGALADWQVPLAGICRAAGVPLVYVSEYSVRTRRQIVRAENPNPLLRARRAWWTTRLERRYLGAIAGSAGVQCNGTPTWRAYRDVSPCPLLFFDTRVRADMVATADALERRLAELDRGGPLRLAFSGRLVAMKGADHLPLVARALAARGVRFTMDVCGGGALEPRVGDAVERFGLARQVRLRGVLDFEHELVPLVRDEVDLFVCCHRQGDPSCTYLETMACGTPIAGYANEAFAGLVEHAGTGWTAPLDDPDALAARIAALDADRATLADAARAARAFATEHTFERTMRLRVEHMLECAGVAAEVPA